MWTIWLPQSLSLLLLASESSENINWQCDFFALFFESWLSCRRCLRGRRMITILERQRFFTTRPGHWWYDNYERVYYCDDYDHNFPHHPSFVIIGGAVIWVIRSNDSSQRGDSGDRKQPEVAAQTKMMRATIKNSNVRITAIKKNPKTLRISGIGLRKAKRGRRRGRFLLMRRRNLIIQQILIRCSSSSTPAQT